MSAMARFWGGVNRNTAVSKREVPVLMEKRPKGGEGPQGLLHVVLAWPVLWYIAETVSHLKRPFARDSRTAAVFPTLIVQCNKHLLS